MEKDPSDILQAAPPAAQESEPAPESPAETPVGEKITEPTVESLQAEIEDLKRQRDRSAAAARRKAEAELAAAKTELSALKRKMESGARPVPPDPDLAVSDPPRYRREQTAYEDTLYEWRRAQEGTAAQAGAPMDGGDNDAAQAFVDRAEILRKKHSDFDEVVTRPVFTRVMQDAIFEAERGPEVAYHLGKNPAEADRIAKLSPPQQMMEIGKIEARFSSTPGRIVSNAPAPINPVEGTSGSTKDPEQMTTEEWMAWDRQRTLARLKSKPF